MTGRMFVVHTNIPAGGVLAHTRGQVIPEQAVTDNGWQDFVHARGTKAAADVQADVSGLDASEFTTTRAGKGASPDSATEKTEG